MILFLFIIIIITIAIITIINFFITSSNILIEDIFPLLNFYKIEYWLDFITLYLYKYSLNFNNNIHIAAIYNKNFKTSMKAIKKCLKKKGYVFEYDKNSIKIIYTPDSKQYLKICLVNEINEDGYFYYYNKKYNPLHYRSVIPTKTKTIMNQFIKIPANINNVLEDINKLEDNYSIIKFSLLELIHESPPLL